MKLVIFDDQQAVLSIYKGKNIEINGDTINIDGDTLSGIRENYIVVEDNDTKADVGETIPTELKTKDKKYQLQKKKASEELQEDVNALKAESATQLTAIADIYEMLLSEGGGQ